MRPSALTDSLSGTAWCRNSKTSWSSASIARPADFVLRLEDGETFQARRVVLAVGITHFEYVPENLAHLPAEFLSHSARHREVEPFRGRSVVVIGGGSSALDLAGLLHEAGADVQLVARRSELKFHSQPTGKPRSWWQQIRHPQSGLGPGMRSRFFADAPGRFLLSCPKSFASKSSEGLLGRRGDGSSETR